MKCKVQFGEETLFDAPVWRTIRTRAQLLQDIWLSLRAGISIGGGLLLREHKVLRVIVYPASILKLAMAAMLLGVTLFATAFSAFSKDIYVAQTTQGNDSGTNAANAHAVSWFNTSGNWGGGSTKISAGDTVHLCGTITSQLSFQGGGGAGNPITLFFEPGADITMPAIPSSDAIALGSYNYLVVDGGSNGVIQSTANGTGLPNNVSSVCIEGTPSMATSQSRTRC